MTTNDNVTQAARAYAESACYQDENIPIAEAGYLAGWKSALAYLTEQEPGVQHLWRPGEPSRAFCGDESARPWTPVTREDSLAVPVCALCHQRAMHESYDLWAEQEPTAAEVEAAAEGIWNRYSNRGMWKHAPDRLRSAFRADARAALSAARRDEEKR